MTVEAIVGDEQLTACGDRLLVALVRIFYRDRLDTRRKSRREIIGMLDELEAVARNKQLARLLRWRRRRST